MSLILDKLACAMLDPKVQAQTHLSKMPKDGVGILVCPEHTIYVACVKEKTPMGDRIYAIDKALHDGVDEKVLKQLAFTAYRIALGNAGLIVTNLNSNDGYSTAKRGVIQAKEAATYTVSRGDDSFTFTASPQQIERVSVDEFDRLLEVFFGDSLITNEDHPFYQKLVRDNGKEFHGAPPVQETAIAVAAPTVGSSYSDLDIDLTNLDFIAL